MTEKNSPAVPLFTMTDLERSHAELRAAVILAGKEIRKLNFGKRDTPVLELGNFRVPNRFINTSDFCKPKYDTY
jgi:hypothetical protein